MITFDKISISYFKYNVLYFYDFKLKSYLIPYENEYKQTCLFLSLTNTSHIEVF